MSLNIIDLIKGQLGPAWVSQAATQLGESESSISKAISGLIPAVVGGAANNSDNPILLDAIVSSESSGLLGNLLGNASGNSLISSVISTIFGDKLSGLVNSIASFAGIGSGSANSLLNTVTAATLGSVGKVAGDTGLDRNGITNLLRDQKGIVSTLLPAGLSLASLGFGNDDSYTSGRDVNPEPTATVSSAKPAEVEVNRSGQTHTTASSSGGGSIWKWLLPLLLLLAAGYFLFKQCENKNNGETVVTESDTMVVDNDTMATMDVEREATTVALPNGQTLNAYRGGIEDELVAFINSQEYENSTDDDLKERWFNFDNLNFEFGTTTLTPESQVQLDNIKAILAAYPDVKIKIGAYTDKKGDDSVNKTLSQERADAVKAALNSAQVTEAEGYGEEFAVVPEEATDQERESDRKTAIRLVK